LEKNLNLFEKSGLRIRIHFTRIRIQLKHFRLNTDPDPDPIRIQGFKDQKWKKKLLLTKKLNFFWIKNYNLPIPRPPYRKSKLQKKPSALKRGHPTLQNMDLKKKLILLWVIFALLALDPDPDSEYGSGSTDPIESGSNPDTDPQPC
jgi:hypothetical protein